MSNDRGEGEGEKAPLILEVVGLSYSAQRHMLLVLPDDHRSRTLLDGFLSQGQPWSEELPAVLCEEVENDETHYEVYAV